MTDLHQSLLDTLAKPPPPPSELDELMSRDPLDLSSQDIDKIIASQRQFRARKEAGGKGKKAKAAAEPDNAPKIDLVALVLKRPQPTEVTLTPTPISAPRSGGGPRRL